MFLIGALGRLDVWPVGDYGVRAGFARAWNLDEVPTPKQLVELASRFAPTELGGVVLLEGRRRPVGRDVRRRGSVGLSPSPLEGQTPGSGAMSSWMPGGPHDPGG